MSRRRSPRLLLVVLAAGVIVGLGTVVTAAPSEAAPPVLPILTEAAATGLVPEVSRVAGTSLSGVWFEDGRLLAGTWDPATAPRLAALGVTPVLRDGRRHDSAAALRSLAGRTAVAMPAGLESYGIDPRTDQLVLDVVDGPGAAALADRMTDGLDPAAVRVERVSGSAHRQASVSGGQTITDGTRRCTAGFAASNGSAQYLLTAGHCTLNSSTWYDADNETIGSSTKSASGGVDAGAIRVDSGAVSPTVAGTRVTGSRVAPVGSSVCLYGSTSGRTCGTVQRTNVTVNFDGQQQSGLTSVGACAQDGDSGGPYITADGQAQGVHTGAGGAGECTSYFTPIASVTRALDLTLRTG